MHFLEYKKNDGDIDDVNMPLIREDEVTSYKSSKQFYALPSKVKKFKNRRITDNYKILPHNFTISGDIMFQFIKRTRFLIIILCAIIYIYLITILISPIQNIPVNHNSYIIGKKDFLVWSEQCKIPNLDPYERHITTYIKRVKYEPCFPKQSLTYVQYNSTTQQYILSINQKRKIYYHSNLKCCYQKIIRNESDDNADNIIKLSKCLSFKNAIQISNTTDNILVKCNVNRKLIEVNGHPMMPERAEIRNRLEAWKRNDTQTAPSILMIGIDSISRSNLIREMPKTAQMLYNDEWYEMSGYNKIDDNTFPNLIAILSGYNIITAKNMCNKLDNCPIIWKLFREHGYATAYAEDETMMSTFNLIEPGFHESPVDYYLRPFMIAAEQNLTSHLKSGLNFCLGHQHSADYVFDYAIELATRFKNNSFFGLFWANSFSHNDISDCSSMDLKVAQYLEKLSSRGILNESVIIFFSDHGMRFGEIRQTVSGYFEERLPFMFIWLPKWLKIEHPEFVDGLSANKNRLTNPYDIHMTLKHLLELSNRTNTGLPKATDCSNCQSLLTQVPYNRSCRDIEIANHWCTCFSYKSIEINSALNYKFALFVTDHINSYLQNFENGSISNLCEILQLHFIVAVYRAHIIGNSYSKNLDIYRLLIRTVPGNGLFEATISYKNDKDEIDNQPRISRLNSYNIDSLCVVGSIAKMYCFCKFPYNSIRYI